MISIFRSRDHILVNPTCPRYWSVYFAHANELVCQPGRAIGHVIQDFLRQHAQLPLSGCERTLRPGKTLCWSCLYFVVTQINKSSTFYETLTCVKKKTPPGFYPTGFPVSVRSTWMLPVAKVSGTGICFVFFCVR